MSSKLESQFPKSISIVKNEKTSEIVSNTHSPANTLNRIYNHTPSDQNSPTIFNPTSFNASSPSSIASFQPLNSFTPTSPTTSGAAIAQLSYDTAKLKSQLRKSRSMVDIRRNDHGLFEYNFEINDQKDNLESCSRLTAFYYNNGRNDKNANGTGIREKERKGKKVDIKGQKKDVEWKGIGNLRGTKYLEADERSNELKNGSNKIGVVNEKEFISEEQDTNNEVKEAYEYYQVTSPKRDIASDQFCGVVDRYGFIIAEDEEDILPNLTPEEISMEYLKSTLSRVVLGKDIPSFPYNVAEKIEAYDGESMWSLHQGTKKEDGSPVSIFTFDCIKQKEKLPLAKNAFKRFRTIRHPDLLRYIDGVETDAYIYIATESVTPLRTHLDSKSEDSSKLWGLYKVGSALKFLNNDCAMIHGNVRISSIFTNKAGEWKLAGFELMSSLKEDNPTYGGLVYESSKYASPEVSTSSWDVLKDHDVWVTDSWNYGTLIYEIYNGPFTSPSQLDNPGSILQSMQASYRQLISTNPKSRPNISSFVDIGLRVNGYFQNELTQIMLFLENMNIKESREKDDFFRKLGATVDRLPPRICKFKILPELINALEFGSGGAKVLPLILKIGNTLDSSEYDSVVMTSIVKMFAAPDRTIRLSLLENLAMFIDRLDSKTVSDRIFSNVATGFTDTAPIIRESTVKSILLLVPKLSDRIINNDLLRYLAKLQMDEEPGIRTNTTICLGKISKYLTETPDSAITEQSSSMTSTTISVASSVAGVAASAAESWTGWAVTSLTKKITGTVVEGEIAASPSDHTVTPSNEKSANGCPTPTSPSVKSDSNVEQSDQDTLDGWENSDNMFCIDNVEKEMNNDSFGQTSESSSSSRPSSIGKKLSYTVATTSMKLGSENKSHPTDSWGLDDDWGNGDWEDDWNVSRPSSMQSTISTGSISPVQKSSTSHTPSKEEKQAELNRRREERRQKMAELKEKKKKGSTLGAKKIVIN
ncbi:5507_t:CDS:10 [Acaulospora colombiana]|uniref:5507_t:CDS:1 n=1 Tax=Acaulospora colombiana TaxID=27376 RepID=A0ACA9JVA5_9GLOM|nr:5507_t:CDS:10 [Acaulospora colombiana]